MKKRFIIYLIVFILAYGNTDVLAVELTSLRHETEIENIYVSPEEEDQNIKFIKERLDNLVTLGLDPIILENIEVKIYPGYSIKYKIDADTYEYYTGYASSKYDISRTNVLSSTIVISNGSSENTLYHELGHIIADKKLGTYGYDWRFVNDHGNEYIKLKNYNQVLPVYKPIRYTLGGKIIGVVG